MSRMTKGSFLKSSCFLWLSYILSLTGQSNPWCNSNCIWLFLIFLAGREFLLNLFPTNFQSCKKTTKLLAQSFSLCDCLICTAGPAQHVGCPLPSEHVAAAWLCQRAGDADVKALFSIQATALVLSKHLC